MFYYINTSKRNSLPEKNTQLSRCSKNVDDLCNHVI
nr:MAG TPA: hypothetical protein [Caudoviricetes sp.]